MTTHQRATLGVAAAVGLLMVGARRAPRAQAQSALAEAPAFEVVSVKPNMSGEQRMQMGAQPGGRFTATNILLRVLIRNAYQLQDFQLVGAPDWINSEHFDIVAKAAGDVPPTPPGSQPGPMQMMLRTLLAERFTLAVHHETRDLPIYVLVLARSDGKLGSQLRPAAVDCEAFVAAARARGGPPAFPPPGERPTCGIRISPGQMTGGGFPLSQLATTLSQFVQRVVVDRTGLTGNFDFDLTWTPDQLPQPEPGGPPGPPIDPNGPSLVTAVQEQLGLKLDSQKAPVDVIVIDHVDRPTAD